MLNPRKVPHQANSTTAQRRRAPGRRSVASHANEDLEVLQGAYRLPALRDRSSEGSIKAADSRPRKQASVESHG